MRKASLSLMFILLGVLFLQAESMTKRPNQISLTGEKSTVNILTSFGFPGLVETSSTQDKTQNIANLFAYYIDGRVLQNTVSSLFYKTQTNNVLTYDQLQNVLTYEGVEKSQLDRLMNLITLDQDNMVDYSEFNRLANVIFNEALTVVTWIYMTKNPIISPTDRVNEDSVEDAILKLFKKIEDLYPPPRCEEIEYLFEKVDEDGDGLLDIEEFHHLLSIFLKYYRSGIENNDYADVIFDDDLYSHSSDSDHSETEATQSSQPSQDLTEDSGSEPTEYNDDLTGGIVSSGSSEPVETEIASESTGYYDGGITEGTQPLSPEATESTPASSEGTESVGETASSQESETEPVVTEDTFGFSYYYPKTESEPEATESTPAATESQSGETEGDTYGFSYYYPATEGTEATESQESVGDEVTEETGSSEPEVTESAPAISDDVTESEPEATESSPAATEGDTYGFSYYYPATEGTEATESQGSVGNDVTEGTPSEPEATESSPAATEGDLTEAQSGETEGDTYGFSYYYPATEETEPTQATESQGSAGDEVTEGTLSEPEATESSPAATEGDLTEAQSGKTEGDTYGFSYYYPATEETEATEEPSEPVGDEVTEATEPSEPAATESTPSATEQAATEGDTYGFSYYYPATEETEATEEPSEAVDDEVTEATEPSSAPEETEADDEATEPTAAAQTQEETESEVSEPTGKEATKAEEETQETEKTQSEDEDESDESDEDDGKSGYSYHYSGSSSSKSKGKSSGKKTYNFGSNASSKFSYSSKRN